MGTRKDSQEGEDRVGLRDPEGLFKEVPAFPRLAHELPRNTRWAAAPVSPEQQISQDTGPDSNQEMELRSQAHSSKGSNTWTQNLHARMLPKVLLLRRKNG